MSLESETAANRSNWDERVAGHLIAYDVDGFVNDPTRLSRVVRDDVTAMAPYLPTGSPAGLDLVHLQCHIGLDTLSWARLGAQVTGVDFSPKSVNAATDIAHRAGLQARFFESEIRYAAERLGEQYDIVYTSIGVLPWLPDLEQWARVVTDLFRPGGLFYIRDSHPILNTLDYDRTDGELVIRQPYFATGDALRYDDGTTYADPAVRLDHSVTYELPHALSEILGALLRAGLTLIAFDEHRTIPWQALPQLIRTPNGFVLPSGSDQLPLTFSVAARK